IKSPPTCGSSSPSTPPSFPYHCSLSRYTTPSDFSFFFLLTRPPPRSTLFPYTTLFRSILIGSAVRSGYQSTIVYQHQSTLKLTRSEEHTSELQSRGHLVCRLLLEKKKRNHYVVGTELI